MTDIYEAIEQDSVGIGVELRDEDGQLVVVRTLPSSPAARSGIRDGDIIERIGRVSVGELIEKKRLAVAARLLQGEVDEQVNVVVRHRDSGERESVRIVPSKIERDTVQGHYRDTDGTWRFMLDEEDRIGYVRITDLAKSTGGEVDAAVGRLRSQDMQTLVLDLRDCPGGLLTAAVETADLFVAQGAIVTTTSRTGGVYRYEAHKSNTYAGFSTIVLVNGRTASAAEILAACLQDYKRATVIGERTSGRGIVCGIFHLKSGGGAVRLPTASFLRPSGKCIHRFPDARDSDDWGVTPDGETRVLRAIDAASQLFPEPSSAATRRQSATGRRTVDRFGLTLEDLPPSEVVARGSRYSGGVRVVSVDQDGPAAKQGIRQGDILVGLHLFQTTSFGSLGREHVRGDSSQFR